MAEGSFRKLLSDEDLCFTDGQQLFRIDNFSYYEMGTSNRWPICLFVKSKNRSTSLCYDQVQFKGFEIFINVSVSDDENDATAGKDWVSEDVSVYISREEETESLVHSKGIEHGVSNLQDSQTYDMQSNHST